MTDLIDNVGKGFWKNNILHNSQKVRVYVENEDDVPFWKHIFNKFDITTVITPQADDGTEKGLIRGKENVLRFVEQVHEYFILCVDSDYDYLLDGATETSKIIKENPYIFQTYTYSIENYKCFVESLHQVVVEATLNDKQIFDYKAFIEKYSKIVYELFLYSFFYERKYQQEGELHHQKYKIQSQSLDEKSLEKWQSDNLPKQIFPLDEFCKCLKIPNKVNIFGQGNQELAALEKEVNKKLASLPQIDQEVLERLKKELSTLGLSPQNTYLFIQGHTVYNNVVLMFLRPVCDHLKTDKIKEFVINARTEKEKMNKINQYEKDTEYMDEYKRNTEYIELTLKLNKNYQNCFLMSKIESDIRRYFSVIGHE